MAQTDAEANPEKLSVLIKQAVFPPYHASHGTPHAVVQRSFTFEFPQGTAEVDQTDYGHPGRFNPPHAKSIPLSLQPATPKIIVAAEALASLLD
ncbi:MAG: hypothetical protein EXR50_03500 [Dehalococcoidia bacterium]|nr:hypothetical protein [Dehalococcoidia bacterium]